VLPLLYLLSTLQIVRLTWGTPHVFLNPSCEAKERSGLCWRTITCKWGYSETHGLCAFVLDLGSEQSCPIPAPADIAPEYQHKYDRISELVRQKAERIFRDKRDAAARMNLNGGDGDDDDGLADSDDEIAALFEELIDEESLGCEGGEELFEAEAGAADEARASEDSLLGEEAPAGMQSICNSIALRPLRPLGLQDSNSLLL
jgi:hypothetical protein